MKQGQIMALRVRKAEAFSGLLKWVHRHKLRESKQTKIKSQKSKQKYKYKYLKKSGLLSLGTLGLDCYVGNQLD